MFDNTLSGLWDLTLVGPSVCRVKLSTISNTMHSSTTAFCMTFTINKFLCLCCHSMFSTSYFINENDLPFFFFCSEDFPDGEQERLLSKPLPHLCLDHFNFNKEKKSTVGKCHADILMASSGRKGT